MPRCRKRRKRWWASNGALRAPITWTEIQRTYERLARQETAAYFGTRPVFTYRLGDGRIMRFAEQPMNPPRRRETID